MRKREVQAKGEEEDRMWEARVRRRGREATMVVGEKTAWEIAREAPSPPVLPSARENSELESMVLVLPPVISDADSM